MQNKFEGNPHNKVVEDAREQYTDEDLEQWRQGAANFQRFWQVETHGRGVQTIKREHARDVEELQTMFLGEKPAIFSNWLALQNTEQLKSFGIEHVGEYVYDPRAVMKVIEEHHEIFTAWKLTTAEHVMAELDKAGKAELHIIRGLVLGYPLESVQKHDLASEFKFNSVAQRLRDSVLLTPKEQKYFLENYENEWDKNENRLIKFFEKKFNDNWFDLGIHKEDIQTLINELKVRYAAKGVYVHGVIWVDRGDSPESQAKQARINAAFEKSKIKPTVVD